MGSIDAKVCRGLGVRQFCQFVMPGAVKKNHSESAIPSLRQRSVKPRPQASTEIDHDQPSEKYAEIVAYESKVHGKTVRKS